MEVPKQIICMYALTHHNLSQYHPYSANVHFYFFSNHLTHLYMYIYRQQRITPIVTYYFDYLDMAQVCSTIFGYSFFLKLCIPCFSAFKKIEYYFIPQCRPFAMSMMCLLWSEDCENLDLRFVFCWRKIFCLNKILCSLFTCFNCDLLGEKGTWN